MLDNVVLVLHLDGNKTTTFMFATGAPDTAKGALAHLLLKGKRMKTLDLDVVVTNLATNRKSIIGSYTGAAFRGDGGN